MFRKRRREPSGLTGNAGESLTNAAVVEAMANVSADDHPEARALLFQLLLETTLLVVTSEAPERSGQRKSGTAEALNLVTLTDEDGSGVPVFTSMESLRKWLTHEAGYVALSSRALFEMAVSTGTNKIVLDPGSPIWGFLTRYEIEQLARGRLPLGSAGDVVAQVTAVRIGRPSNPPSEAALGELRTQMSAVASVQRAWYFLMQQGEQKPELVIGVQFEAGVDPHRGLMRGIIDNAGNASPDTRDLVFMVPDEKLRASLDTGSGQEFFARG